MPFVLPFARALVVILCALCISFPAQALDRQAARRFESLATTQAGGLYNFPQEIRTRRTGPVVQEVKIDDDGLMTIRFSFSCRDDGQGRRAKKAHTFKQFYLSDFLPDGGKYVEVNLHTNTMTIFEHAIGWTLVFPTPAVLEQATAAFKVLVRSLDAPSIAPKKRPSELARSAGYRYLVAVPRCQTIEDGLRLFSLPDQSPKLFFFLTRQQVTQPDLLLAESTNASPLCIFDLSVLDQTPFFTLPLFGSTNFSPCDIEGEVCQSALSDDVSELQRFFKSPFVGIRFFSLPKDLLPTKILCRWHDCRWLQRHSAELMGSQISCEEIIPLFYEPEAPQGTTTGWLSGIHESSDDILRFFFHKNSLDAFQIGTTLGREYPGLGRLLQEKSRYRNDCSIGGMIEKMLRECPQEAQLPERQRLVLQVALFSHGLGAPFGPESELIYNSWPFALTLGEKLGFSEHQKNMLEALLSATPSLGKPPQSQDVCTLLQHEAITAGTAGLSLQEWIRIKLLFLQTTAKQLRSYASYKSYLRVFEQLLSHPQLHNIDLPSGMGGLLGSYPVRRLFSSYLWEPRDPQHRDGLSLLRRREKFEYMILDHPHSPWKGRFWDWLNKDMEKEPLSPGVYLSAAERPRFLAKFENGQLVSPELPKVEGELEMMFVVDGFGNMYIGQKRDGKGKDDTSFNHAGFFAGGPVASAGKIFFIDGKLTGINDHSGHYRSGAPEMKIAVEVLERNGVALDTIAVNVGAGAGRKKQDWKSACQFLQHLSPSHFSASPSSDVEEQPSAS